MFATPVVDALLEREGLRGHEEEAKRPAGLERPMTPEAMGADVDAEDGEQTLRPQDDQHPEGDFGNGQPDGVGDGEVRHGPNCDIDPQNLLAFLRLFDNFFSNSSISFFSGFFSAETDEVGVGVDLGPGTECWRHPVSLAPKLNLGVDFE